MPWKVLIATSAITILLAIALLKGINGAILASGMSIIAGIGGYSIGRVTSTKNKPP